MTTTGKDRFEKYKNELEAHLEKVNNKLDEEIRNMRNKLKETKQSVQEKAESHKELKSLNDELLKQIDAAAEELDLKKERQLKTQELTEQLEKQMQADVLEKKELQKENSLLNTRLDQLTVGLVELENQLKRAKIAGDEKSARSQLEKAKQEQETLKRRKAVQDAAIERLRQDITVAESSTKRLDSAMLKEIERRVKLESETDALKTKCAIFVEENLGLEDEFEKLLETLKRTENEATKKAADAKKASRKKRAVLAMNEEYFQELRKNVETSQNALDEGTKHVKELRRNKKREEQEIEKLQKTLHELQEYKGLDREKEQDTISNAKLIEEKIKEYEEKRQRNIAQLIKLKENMVKMFTNSPTSKSSNRNSSVTRLMATKKNLLVLKREENALIFKTERLNHEREDSVRRLIQLQKNIDTTADELRQAEIEKEKLRHERGPMDTITLDSMEEKIRKDLEARRADLEQHIQKLINENESEKDSVERLRIEVVSLSAKLTKFGPVDVARFHEEIDDKRKEEHRLSNYYSNLLKQARQKQKELELCVVQRDSAVDRAHSLVYLNTSIRAERQSEIEQIKERIREKRKELESVLVD